MSEETGTMSEKALHILRAAVADARDEPGVYVSRVRVMEQTGVCDLEEFERIAEDLAERGFINQGVNRYEFFMVMLRGIGAGATEATPESREAPRRSRRMRIMARPPAPRGCSILYSRALTSGGKDPAGGGRLYLVRPRYRY